MGGKLEELTNLERMLKEKMTEDERMKMNGLMVSKILGAISKRLIKTVGYDVTSTILQRELREIGKINAKELMGIFGFKEKTPENASKILKIATLILGFKLDVADGETVIKECSFGTESLQLKEPFLCNVCLEYCRGVIEEMLGGQFTLERTKSLVSGDPYCMFKIKKR